MANTWGWARGVLVAGMGVSCSGVDAPLPGGEAARAGSSSVYLHGEAGSACGGVETAGGSAIAPLPSDFDAGPAEAGSPGATSGAVDGAPLARAFIISEYVEGSSTYKALEISALEDSSLDGCRVALYFNGGTTASGSELEGTLLGGQSYVLCSSALSELVTSCDGSAGLTFNGDDAIALECDGVPVDVIGQIGFDPGTSWGSGALSLVDHTLRRRCEVVAGDADGSDAFDPSSEWLGFEQDAFDDLGAQSCSEPAPGGAGGSGGQGQPQPPARAFVISEYVEGSSTYKALEITALADSSLDGCRIALYFNGGTSPSGSELEGTLLAGQSHVVCSSSLGELIQGCDQSAGLTFNGDDAIVLECDGAPVDVIGQIGFDPGTAWGSGDLSLVDHTLRRGCAVTTGDGDPADAFDPIGEWTGFAQDSFDDLGLRACP